MLWHVQRTGMFNELACSNCLYLSQRVCILVVVIIEVRVKMLVSKISSIQRAAPSKQLFSTLLSTHEVTNQSNPLQDYNVYDHVLDNSIKKLQSNKSDIQTATSVLTVVGKMCGSSEMLQHSDAAQKNKPVLKQFDNYGRRIDVAEYHASYHTLMNKSLSCGGAAYGYSTTGVDTAHIMRAGIIYMLNQLEPGHCCPVVMTSAAIPVLRKLDYMSDWTKKLLTHGYDPRNVPISEKVAVTCGMSMTEKQGGSDVRANTTTATPITTPGEGQAYSLIGHKWFTSAPMSDGFLTLAKTTHPKTGDIGLSCFLVPRWKPDGSRNTGFQIMRLKDKLGDHSNASSEVEYRHAYGTLIGEPNKGVKTIIEMVQATRLDCILGSAGGMRKGLHAALNHSSHRAAFGKTLIDQPLMSNLLIELCVESEAHTLTAMKMAALYNNYHKPDASESEKELFRLVVSICKYYTTKRQPNFIYECMEVCGGNGYVEDFPMARLFRQSPLNSIWEGSGNVIALDILKVAKSFPLLFQELSLASGLDSRYDAYIKHLQKDITTLLTTSSQSDPTIAQKSARYIADHLALAFQASVMLRYGHSADSTQAFIECRLPALIPGSAQISTGRGGNYGTHVFSSNLDTMSIIQRNHPFYQQV